MNIKALFEQLKKRAHGQHNRDLENNHRMKYRLEIKIEHDRLIHQRRALRRELNFYHQRKEYSKANDLQQKLSDIEMELADIHLKQRMRNISSVDLNRYYRHIKITRPIVLSLNLLLWFLLFRFGGVQTGFKIFILLFALITSLVSLSEMYSLSKINERILKPVNNLKRGVEEISKGNYSIQVEPGKSNEVGSLIEAFNKMAQKLDEAERLKAEYEENRKALITNISHDLKTPITSVQGYIEAIEEQNSLPSDKLKRYLKIIYNNTAYMNKLIDDLFLFSKLDMQKLDFHFEEIPIRPFFFDLMEEQRLDLEERNILFVSSDELSCERIVKMDAKRLYQILRNLIDNAVKYGPQAGLTIKTRLYENGGNIRIDVLDNGEGIEENQLPHIFERFYRVDKERTKDLSSTGLGLAIAKELAQAHGGDITVQSSKDAGTCFTVTLPYVEPL